MPGKVSTGIPEGILEETSWGSSGRIIGVHLKVTVSYGILEGICKGILEDI